MNTKFVNANQSLNTDNSMKKTNIGLVIGIALLGALTGCVGYVDGPHARVYVQPPPVQVQTEIIVENDYVYYPGYQVYYSGRTRQYVYLDGSVWVTRPAPPRVSVDVLFASPSVRVDFHDAPAMHHAMVARIYPTSWTPPGWKHGNKGGNGE